MLRKVTTTQCRTSSMKINHQVLANSSSDVITSFGAYQWPDTKDGRYRYFHSRTRPNDSDYNRTFKKWNSIAIALGLVTTGGALLFNQIKGEHKSGLFPIISASTDLSKKGLRLRHNFIADVVEVSAPSVVYIEIKDTRRLDYRTRQPLTASNGSGFIVESDGLILTNAHVVINKPHTVVSVKLQDGRTFVGHVEDIDPSSDLATVRIECGNLPAMKLGKSANTRAGEWVVALGSPLALNNTVTAGVISTTQRPSEELGLKGNGIKYIQTDAAITFGNSGGPLVNLDGEAIGINSMKVTAGISFAIPIDHAKDFLQKGIDRRSRGSNTKELLPVRRYMGITMLTLTDDILSELRQRSHTVPDDVKHGVLVWKVILGSPAHAGGLSPGDIITHINGKEVRKSSEIYEVLAEKGKELHMSLYRSNRRLNVTVIPEDPDESS